VAALQIPQDYEEFDPQLDGLVFKVPCHQRVGGTIIYYPIAVLYMDGI